jgi:hypothetical protein
MTTIDQSEPPPRGEKQSAIITDIMVEQRLALSATPTPRSFHTEAFSNESLSPGLDPGVDTGSRDENASKQKARLRF